MVLLEFHSIVESQALIPGVNGSNCLTTCDDIETSCGNSVYGCTDLIAENYNPNANIDDNSCEYIYGCMSPNADNYNSEATMDDGSCVCSGSIDLYIETDYYSNEVSWELLDSNGLIIDSGDNYFQGGQIIESSYCLAEGCYLLMFMMNGEMGLVLIILQVMILGITYIMIIHCVLMEILLLVHI